MNFTSWRVLSRARLGQSARCLLLVLLSVALGIVIGAKVFDARELPSVNVASTAAPAQPNQDLTYDWANDPIGAAFYKKVPPMLETVLKQYAAARQYSSADFPLSPGEHKVFRDRILDVMVKSMTGKGGNGLDWMVKDDDQPGRLRDRFRADHVAKVTVHGLEIVLFTLTIADTGDVVPAALCYPGQTPAPAILAFSGHTHFGLRELYVDLDSYQQGIAWRLCKAGFVTAAIEKIDSGISSTLFQKKGEHWRDNIWADDEDKIATTLLGTGDYQIPARQLMANIALAEFMAEDPRVLNKKMGAVGISLGGWLTLHTALVNGRIKAIANFGGMWSYLEEYLGSPENKEFAGINDFSQLFPGIWMLGDQNRFLYAAAPVPMLTGYGRNDVPYVNFKKYFHPRIQEQYQLLGKPGDIEVYIHDGGHVLPSAAVIRFFKERFAWRGTD